MNSTFSKLFVLSMVLLVLVNCRLAHRNGYSEDKRIWNLTREGFIHELLFPEATPRTLEFDDYTPNSYHIDKDDLLEGIRASRLQHKNIVGIVIRGPLGPIWAYDVYLFISETDKVRMNRVLFPHARITWKATKLLPWQEYSDFISHIASSDSVTTEISKPKSGMIVVDWSTDSERVWHFTESYYDSEWKADAQALDQYIHEFGMLMTTTYSNELPDGYSIHDDEYIENKYGP